MFDKEATKSGGSWQMHCFVLEAIQQLHRVYLVGEGTPATTRSWPVRSLARRRIAVGFPSNLAEFFKASSAHPAGNLGTTNPPELSKFSRGRTQVIFGRAHADELTSRPMRAQRQAILRFWASYPPASNNCAAATVLLLEGPSAGRTVQCFGSHTPHSKVAWPKYCATVECQHLISHTCRTSRSAGTAMNSWLMKAAPSIEISARAFDKISTCWGRVKRWS
mmetsp:Transcript_146323/g.469411  ORF Transcript_146323/g.469411 Transcript_146323/m.469411 type:complete len:221 (-) Transcript_146323:1114-1776(-)